MIILGIDPGASGGLASFHLGCHENEITPMSFSSQTETDISERLRNHLAGHDNCNIFAYLEHVHAFPKQGVSGVFRFGQSYGFLRGCLIALQIPFDLVSPRKWQQAMGCLSGGDKNVTKARAQQLFPSIKVTHAIADSILIAEYGRRLRAGEL